MADQDIPRIIAAVADRTIGAREQITLQEFLAAEPCAAIRAFVRSEVVRWLEDDLRQSRRFSAVAANPGGAGTALRALVHTAAPAYLFIRSELADTIDDAIHFVANYLCRPRWTLREVLFADTERMSSATLQARLADVPEYRYLIELALAYVRTRGVRELDAAGFDTLLAGIERQIVRRDTPAGLAGRATPMFEFFAIGASAENGIPLGAATMFLSEKGLGREAEAVERWSTSLGRTRIRQSEFAAILAGEETPGAPEPAHASETNPPFPPQAVPAADQLPPLSSSLTAELHSFFLRTIFEDDSAFYAGVLEALDFTPTWREAEFHLRTLFENRGIDPSSEPAARFSEAVRRRYTPERE